jgi:pyrimidine-nucleoside phosphorylase
VIAGAGPEIAPADRRLYALRDVTATVGSIPLITASIMSKKLAENLDALVLDVKCGRGTFIHTREAARRLAESLIRTGRRMGVRTTALITDMNRPLGRLIGNAVEVDEAVELLEGRGPADLRELTVRLAAELLVNAEVVGGVDDAVAVAQRQIDSGTAREKLREMVAAQGGDLDAPRPRASAHEWPAPAAGFVTAIDTRLLGSLLIELGGGRRTMADRIDPSVGLEMLVRLGDAVQHGQPLVRIFAPTDTAAHQAADTLSQAVSIGPDPVRPPPLIIERIEP